MDLRPLPIQGAALACSAPHEDGRGAFARLFCEQSLQPLLGGRHIVQANFSRTTDKGAIRGMHVQAPPALEMKLVRCLRGRVFDVIVDLRQHSPTFLKWHGEALTPDRWNMMVVPEGVAHGFQTLESDCEMLYLHTAAYAPEHEAGIRFDDPRLAIDWPLPPTGLSDRDRSHPLIDDAFKGVAV